MSNCKVKSNKRSRMMVTSSSHHHHHHHQQSMSILFDEAISLIFSFLTMHEHLSWSLVGRRQRLISLWPRSAPRLCSSIAPGTDEHRLKTNQIYWMMTKFINATKLEIADSEFIFYPGALQLMPHLRELTITNKGSFPQFSFPSYVTTLTNLERVKLYDYDSPFNFDSLPRSVKHLFLISTGSTGRHHQVVDDDNNYHHTYFRGMFELSSLNTLVLPRNYSVRSQFFNDLAIKLPLLTSLNIGTLCLSSSTTTDDRLPLLANLTSVRLTLDTTLSDGMNQVKILKYLSSLPKLTSLELDITTSNPSGYLSEKEQSGLITVMKVLAASFKFLTKLALEIFPNHFSFLRQLTSGNNSQSPLIASLRSFELSVPTTDPTNWIDCSIFSVWSNLTSLKIVCDAEILFPRLPKLQRFDLSAAIVVSAASTSARKFNFSFAEKRLRRCIERYSNSLTHLILPPRSSVATGENENEKNYYNFLVDPDHGISQFKKLAILEIPRCWKSIDSTEPPDCSRLMDTLSRREQATPQIYFT